MGRFVSVAPLSAIVTPVPMHRSARVTIVMPAIFALRFRMFASIRAPWVNAKTRKGMAIRRPSTRCMSSIAMKNEEYFVKATR